MSEDILDVYERLLSTHAIPFEAIRGIEDWHLTAFVVPSFTPETIYDLDHRGGRTLFYRTRFRSSLWGAIYEARENRGKVQPLAVERACAELPPESALVSMIQGECLFRLPEVESLGCDGTTYTLVHAFSGGTRRLRAWEAQGVPAWAALLDAIRDAEAYLPRSGTL